MSAITINQQTDGSFLVGDQEVASGNLLGHLQRLGADGNFTVGGQQLSISQIATRFASTMPSGDRAVLPAPNPEFAGKSTEALAAMLQKLQMEVDELQAGTATEAIKSQKEKKAAVHRERMEKLSEELEKLSEAADKEKKSGVWGKVGKAFAILGTAIAVGVCIGLAVFTGGATLAAAAAIVSVAGTMLIAKDVVDLATDGKTDIFAEVGKACGMSDEAAAKFSMGMTIGLSVVVAIGSIVTGVGAAKAASDAAQFGIKVATTTASVASALPQGTTGIAQGVIGRDLAELQKEAADLRAEGLEFQKYITKIQSLMEEEGERLQEIIEKIQSGFNFVIDVMKDVADTDSFITAQMKSPA